MTQEEQNNDLQAMFDEALAKNQKERGERKEQRMGGSSSGGNGGFEVIKWFGLENKVEKVFRIYGNPIELRKNGTDPKLFYHSKLLNDKKEGYVNIIWKQTSDGLIDENWILYQLLSFVLRKEFVKYADGHKNEKGYDGEYQYIYSNSETYRRIDSNKKKDASPKFFAPSSKPRARVAMNIRDRHDNWCLENNHSKCLTAKLSYWRDDENGNPIYFPDMGIPEMVYNKIMDDVVAYRHHWNLDIVVMKDADNKDYIVRDILEEKISEEAKKLGNAELLTPEEMNIELYNFDEMRTFSVTSYSVLYKRLIGLFKMADAEFNQNFTEQLEKLVEKEQEEKNEGEKAKIEEGFDEMLSNDTNIQKPEVKEGAPVVINSTSENVENTIPDVSQLEQTRRVEAEVDEDVEYKKHFPSWDKLRDVEKKQMRNLVDQFDGGVPVYKVPKDAMPCSDKNCKFLNSDVTTTYPATVATCPICGKVDS